MWFSVQRLHTHPGRICASIRVVQDRVLLEPSLPQLVNIA
jgi:hypothetical protein